MSCELGNLLFQIKGERRDVVKIIFVCEICGSQSEDQAKIQDCESLGRSHKYHKGQRVEFFFAPSGRRIWLPGEVEEIEFERGTHIPRYIIRAGPETLRKMGVHPNDRGGSVTIGSYGERDIRRSSG